MKIQQRLRIVYRRLDEIRPDPRNPRKHSRRQIEQLARIINKLGFNVPLLLDRDGKLLAGHARYEACKRLGLREVPTICLEHLDVPQAQAFMLADNRLGELSQWDDALLAVHLKELSEVLDFDVELSGFEIGEIDFRLESLTGGADGEADPADILPPSVQQALPVTGPGDQWQLGGHCVRCANALEEDSYVALMNGNRASIILADVPYNIPIAGNVSGLGRIKHRDFAMASGEMNSSEFIAFLTRTCALFARFSKDGSLHYLFIDWRHIYELIAAGISVYSGLKNIAVWVKDLPGMGSLYRSQHELIAIFKSGHRPHINNIELGRHGRNRSNVWTYPSVASFGRATEEGNLLELHPTVKPVGLLADAIMDSTKRAEIVLDGFLGSGSTVIAAERTGRRCYGIEIDPLYVDITVRRWEAFTRGEARDVKTGLTFKQREAAVCP